MRGIVKLNQDSGKYELRVDSKILARSTQRDYFEYHWKRKDVPKLSVLTSIQYESEQPLKAGFQRSEVADLNEFDINERFKIMSSFVRLVATGIAPSTIIIGPGGLGKSHTVTQTLNELGFKEAELATVVDQAVRGKSIDDDNLTVDELIKLEKEAERLEKRRTSFSLIKGYSTAKGLYKLLYENRSNLIVFDDCDSVLKDPTSVDLLKSALDSYENRTITWNLASTADKGDLPRSFKFSGSIIFITNLLKAKLPQPLLSRSLPADVSMTRQEVIDRMGFIASQPSFLPSFSAEVKGQALSFLQSQVSNERIRELNLRSLINVAKIRQGGDKNWERVALYALLNANVDD